MTSHPIRTTRKKNNEKIVAWVLIVMKFHFHMDQQSHVESIRFFQQTMYEPSLKRMVCTISNTNYYSSLWLVVSMATKRDRLTSDSDADGTETLGIFIYHFSQTHRLRCGRLNETGYAISFSVSLVVSGLIFLYASLFS